jgi:hypothetical protein
MEFLSPDSAASVRASVRVPAVRSLAPSPFNVGCDARIPIETSHFAPSVDSLDPPSHPGPQGGCQCQVFAVKQAQCDFYCQYAPDLNGHDHCLLRRCWPSGRLFSHTSRSCAVFPQTRLCNLPPLTSNATVIQLSSECVRLS